MKWTSMSFGIAWGTTAIAAVLVAVLLFPPEARLDGFWGYVAWTQFLIAAFWAGSFLYAIDVTDNPSTRGFGGIAPSLGLIVSSYCVVSFAAMLAYAAAGSDDTWQRLHLAIQVVIAAVAIVSSVSVQFAWAGASIGFRRGDPSDRSLAPLDLASMLAARIADRRPAGAARTELPAELERLRDTLKFSLHESQNLMNAPEYVALSERIAALCDSLGVNGTKPVDDDDRMLEMVRSLIVEARAVVDSMIRR